MQLKQFKKILLLGICVVSINANDILSNNQLELIKLSKQKNIKDSDKLKINWINPITYTYSHQYNEKKNIGKTKTSTISINQPIFISGGIYSAIKYASNIKDYGNISLEIQKKELIKQAYNIVFNIKKIELQIKKQNLAIDNAIIDLKIKKESVFNGLLDISFLNNSLISKNTKRSALLDLEYTKQSLINSFKNLSTLSYKEVVLPKLSQISNKDFEAKNIYLKKDSIDIKSKKNMQWITTSQYLPSVNLNYTYTKDHILNKSNNLYGFSVVVPLDFKSFDDSGASKIEYLKAKKSLTIEKIKQNNFLDTKNLKIDTINKKINLTKENIVAYNELLEQTKELYNAGMKTKDDVAVLQNSLEMEKLNLKIFDIDKQLELLEIYARIMNDTI